MVLVFGFILLLSGQLIAGVTASISGTVTDASGAVVAGATVTATNVGTGLATTQTTNGQGFYSFQALPLGTYTLDVQQTGFKALPPDGTRGLDVNSALVVDVDIAGRAQRLKRSRCPAPHCTWIPRARRWVK